MSERSPGLRPASDRGAFSYRSPVYLAQEGKGAARVITRDVGTPPMGGYAFVLAPSSCAIAPRSFGLGRSGSSAGRACGVGDGRRSDAGAQRTGWAAPI